MGEVYPALLAALVAADREQTVVGEVVQDMIEGARPSRPRRTLTGSWRRVSSRPSPSWTSRRKIRAIACSTGVSVLKVASAFVARNGQPALAVGAERVVGTLGEQAALSLLPEQHHGFLHEREYAGLVGGIGQEPLEQPGLECTPTLGGRLLDGTLERGAAAVGTSARSPGSGQRSDIMRSGEVGSHGQHEHTGLVLRERPDRRQETSARSAAPG